MAGLLDFLLSPNQMGGGLLSQFTKPRDPYAREQQESPLDTAQYPAGPMGAPQPQQQPGMGAMAQAEPQKPGYFENGMGGLRSSPTLMGGLLNLISGNNPNAGAAEALQQMGVPASLAPLVMKNPTVIAALLQNKLGMGGQTSDIKEFEYAKKNEGFKGTFADWIANKRAGAGEYGLNGIWGAGPDGKPAIIQLGKNGKPILTPMPDGFQPARDPIKVDGPTGTAILDPQTRQMVGFIPKDVAGAAAQRKVGEGQGEAQESLASIKSKMPGLETVIGKLDGLSEKATYTLGGQALDYTMRQAGMEPREASVARAEYESTVSNQILPLLRDTFGAQFTEREGATLRATLGDVNKSPKEKQAVLKAFIQQKRRDIEALETRVSGKAAPPSTAAKGLKEKYGLD